ncbi:MAG: Nif3-like dinuclear metal center hexameric protein [Verrucomicrobia bacterium]|nr:Nif3-like dinuclear metal center hexameric protein [Verrucomicrobiota bacterium]
MALLADIVTHVDRLLRTAEIPDYPGALNGLQLENSGRVTRIAAAVDAHFPVVEKAIAAGADLLLVHHGLFWSGTQPITGPLHRKLKLAMDRDLAIVSQHLPLDAHPQFGNNALIALALGLDPLQAAPAFPFKGTPLGWQFEVEMNRDVLVRRLRKAIDAPVQLCPGGPRTTRRIGICSGGAGSEIAAVAAAGIDTFITGEGPHWSYTAAEELGVNLLYGGHYATETFGVRALAAHLAAEFNVEWVFIHHPTGR